jgi:hypothetical protein
MLVLMWFSLVSAMVRPSHSAYATVTFFSVQATCLAAVLLEAGSLESGRKSGLRRPPQALALLAFVAHMAASCVEMTRSISSF